MPEDRSNIYKRSHYDRITTLLEKGSKELVRVIALRENVSISEIVRRSVLSRGGLKLLPFPEELDKLTAVKTQEEARKAVKALQTKEESSEIIHKLIDELSPDGSKKKYTVSVPDAEIHDIKQAFQSITDQLDSGKVTLTGRETGILRRFLANIEQV